MSNCAGKNPVSVVSTFDKLQKKHITVERLFIVAEYNRHMGGVDLTDCVMGHYKIRLRSKRWFMRLFYHFLHTTMCNARQLYRRIQTETKNTGKVLNSADFRLEIVETLIKYKKTNRLKRSSDVEVHPRKKRGFVNMSHQKMSGWINGGIGLCG
ncbi:PiggyBac transposable element-derived protein 1 [Eumeta japonica]|uniref:PiggyBac transposable element-derived protein 1 n=1 Tax=Eumeta variegata TaxID=151549 RepID=A0A4C1S9C9_EUMVA|nr:PiggyBac transposable element-derived protein 1 [Eumeta japonica]